MDGGRRRGAAPAGQDPGRLARVRRGAADGRIDAVESREVVVSGGGLWCKDWPEMDGIERRNGYI